MFILQARWALEYHSAPYDWSVYKPLHSELFLRWKLWQWTGGVSVPVLLTAEGTLDAVATRNPAARQQIHSYCALQHPFSCFCLQET